jgi:hypothetical protein
LRAVREFSVLSVPRPRAGHKPKLYWRERPELEPVVIPPDFADGMPISYVYVYSRLLIVDDPSLAIVREVSP